MERSEHCAFAKLDKNGKCIALCFKNTLQDGFMVDCIDIKSDTIEEYCSARLSDHQKLH